MHSKKLLAILFAFVAACAACKPDPDPPPPQCELAQDGAYCEIAADCCSGKCATNNVCVKEDCQPEGAGCDSVDDCCTGECNGTTCGAQCTLSKLGDSCNLDADCCSGDCAPNHICVRQPCAATDATCSTASDCCTGACDDTTTKCFDPEVTCPNPDPATCQLGTECCYGKCAHSTCLGPDPGPNGALCTSDRDCVSGYCSPTTSPRICADPPPCLSAGTTCDSQTAGQCCSKSCVNGQCEGCLARGSSCTAATADQCCSKACDATNHCAKAPCRHEGDSCERNQDCCLLNCSSPGSPGATCQAEQCSKVGEACGSGCCNGNCVGGQCVELPSGPSNQTCKTTGEACTLDGDCCTDNCQAGVCRRAGPCSVKGDVCWKDTDCCSGICGDRAITGQAERCYDAPGDCTQSGTPCYGNASNCCTKKCEDIGYGTTVCKVPPGCVMTGDYCDSNFSCCGGTNEDDPTQLNTYGVFCDLVGENKDVTAPDLYDPSKSDTMTCARGQACNPTGNACGDGASWNCCGGKKEVCKYDSAGIRRCFGVPGCCEAGTCDPDVQACCVSGYTGEPPCCIDENQVCQFRDQCCNGAPCVPDQEGILRCAQGCEGTGETCDPAAPDCCEGLTCRNVEGWGFICALPPRNCELQGGASCTAGAPIPDCCVAPYDCIGGKCATCSQLGGACNTDAQCCSGYSCDLEMGVCFKQCIPDAGQCTGDTDCCSGTCDKPSGATSGTCSGGTTCSWTGQPCQSTSDCCSTYDACIGGSCESTACTVKGDSCTMSSNPCCDAGVCYALDQYFSLTGPCTPQAEGTTGCTCGGACAATNNPCSTLDPCCSTSDACKDASNAACTSSTLGNCTCKPTGGA